MKISLESYRNNNLNGIIKKMDIGNINKLNTNTMNSNSTKSIVKKSNVNKSNISNENQQASKSVINQTFIKLVATLTALAGATALLLSKKGKQFTSNFKIIYNKLKDERLQKKAEQERLKHLANTMEMRKKIQNLPGAKAAHDKVAEGCALGDMVETFPEAKVALNITTGRADILNIVKKDAKETGSNELLDFFTKKDAANFVTPAGLLFGKDEVAKKKLMDYYISEAEKSGIIVERFRYSFKERNGDELTALFDKCIKRYQTENKQSLIVIDNAEDFLKRVGTMTGNWNEYSQKFDEQGITALLTSNDIESLDGSAIRPGRVNFHVDVDKIASEIKEKL